MSIAYCKRCDEPVDTDFDGGEFYDETPPGPECCGKCRDNFDPTDVELGAP